MWWLYSLSLSPGWLQRQGLWLKVFFKSTHVSVVSDHNSLSQVLQTCYGHTSQPSEAFPNLGLELLECPNRWPFMSSGPVKLLKAKQDQGWAWQDLSKRQNMDTRPLWNHSSFLSLSLHLNPQLFWCEHVPWFPKTRRREQSQIFLGLATAWKFWWCKKVD